MTARLPNRCRRCGTQWLSSAVAVSGLGAGITFKDNKETCPGCGALVPMPDGKFNATGHRFEPVRASADVRKMMEEVYAAFNVPGTSKADFEALRAVLEAASSGELDDKEVEAAAARINQSFVHIVRIIARMGWRNGLTLLAIYISIMAYQSSSKDHDEVMSAVARQYEVTSQNLEVNREILKELRARSADEADD